MGWWEDIKQGVREKAAELAKDHPETAEKLARWYGGDDTVDMVKFLYAEEPGLKDKIDAAKKDPMFAKIYDTVYASTKAQIEEQAKKLPPEWDAAAKAAGIPVDQLVQRMQENGAEKITFAIASSVREEVESMAWYTGRIAGDTFQQARDRTWKTPEKSFGENPLGWISTMIGNVFNLIGELFSTKRADMEQRGEQFVAADTAARAEEIVTKMGKMLHTERKMPASFTADTMVAVYEQLKGKADPNFHMSDADKNTLRSRFLTQLQAATPAAVAEQPQQRQQEQRQQQRPQQQQQPGYSGQEVGLPGIASDAEAAAAAKPEGPHSMATRFIRREEEFKPKYPELPELYSLDDASLRTLGIGPLSGNGIMVVSRMMFASNDEEMFNILKRYVPEATKEMDGEHIIVNAKGLRFYLNKPGISMQDVNSLGPGIIALVAAWVTGGASTAIVGGAGMGTIGALATHATIAGLSMAGSKALSEWANGYDDESMGEVFFSLAQGAALGPLGTKVMGAAKGTWGAILRKTATNQSLTSAEEQIVRAAGIDKSALEDLVIKMARSKGVALTVGGSAAVAAGTASAADAHIPHEDIDPAIPVKPGRTPTPAPSESYDMSFPLIP